VIGSVYINSSKQVHYLHSLSASSIVHSMVNRRSKPPRSNPVIACNAELEAKAGNATSGSIHGKYGRPLHFNWVCSRSRPAPHGHGVWKGVGGRVEELDEAATLRVLAWIVSTIEGTSQIWPTAIHTTHTNSLAAFVRSEPNSLALRILLSNASSIGTPVSSARVGTCWCAQSKSSFSKAKSESVGGGTAGLFAGSNKDIAKEIFLPLCCWCLCRLVISNGMFEERGDSHDGTCSSAQGGRFRRAELCYRTGMWHILFYWRREVGHRWRNDCNVCHVNPHPNRREKKMIVAALHQLRAVTKENIEPCSALRNRLTGSATRIEGRLDALNDGSTTILIFASIGSSAPSSFCTNGSVLTS
jgi:hypothetical protein